MTHRYVVLILLCIAFYLTWMTLGEKLGFIREVPVEPETEQVELDPPPPRDLDVLSQIEEMAPEETQEGQGEPEPEPELPDIPPAKARLQNELIELVLDNRGAVVRKARLTQFVASQKDRDAIRLVSAGDHYPAEVILADGTSTGEWLFHMEQPLPNEVHFRASRDGIEIIKEFRLGERYAMEFDVRVRRGQEDLPYYFVISEGLQPRDALHKKPTGFFTAGSVDPTTLDIVWSEDGDIEKKGVKKLPDRFERAMEEEDFVQWAGVNDIYFANVCVPSSPLTNLYISSTEIAVPDMEEPLTKPLVAFQVDGSLDGMFYMGPKEEEEILAANPKLENLISYGWAGLLSKWLFKLLSWLHRVTGNWGWSIIILTGLIRMALMPMTIPSIRSSFKMRKIQPKIEALRKKFGGSDLESKQKLSQETFKLYKQEGVNPFSSCITMLPQIPIFFAYFSLLRSSISLRQSEWMLWISDLSTMDGTYILPIIMGVTMYLSQLTMPMPGDAMQQKMMKFMPVFMCIMFIGMPSGLILYMITSNLFQLGQTYLMKWRYSTA